MHSGIYLAVLLVATMHWQCLPTVSATVEIISNEQIRDGLLSLLSSYNALENKLERHEQRERALGEVIKKGLQQLQKGQRIFEPMRGSFSRLDERLSQLETMLLAQESSQKDQTDKLSEALKKLFNWMSDHDSKEATRAADFATLLAAKPTKEDDSDEDDLGKKIEDLSDSVKRMRQEIAEVAADRSTTESSTKQLVAQAERLVNSKLALAEELSSKLEEKINSFYVTTATTVAPTPLHNTAWENNVETSLASIQGGLQELRADMKPSTANAGPTFDKDFFLGMRNETLEAIEDMRIEVLAASDKSTTKASMRIKEATTSLDASISEISRGLTESMPTVEALYDRVGKSYTDLQNEVAALGRLETILLSNSETIMDVKRSQEFNKLTIKEEIGELVRKHVDTIDQTLNRQFGMLNETISSNHNDILTNFTKTIELEVSLVWRQISIIANEVENSKTSLVKLNEQTESYVNGTFATMEGMGGKVSLITERMAEVDSNLNYLLGRLSLVTQEFNQIKDGLGKALDNIKKSFKTVQNKIEKVGPGPHNIDSRENETDDNSVPQNDQPASSASTTP